MSVLETVDCMFCTRQMFRCFYSRLGVEHLKSLAVQQHYDDDSEALDDFSKATSEWLKSVMIWWRLCKF